MMPSHPRSCEPLSGRLSRCRDIMALSEAFMMPLSQMTSLPWNRRFEVVLNPSEPREFY
jgi:hypothetical protein